MKQEIYASDFNFGPEATKKQSMLFDTDVAYASSEGYKYIQPANGPVFLIDGNNLIEQPSEEELDFEEELAEFAKSLSEPEKVCKHCDNLQLIDGIIHNTLSAKVDKINPEQADTMLKLAHLQSILMDNH